MALGGSKPIIAKNKTAIRLPMAARTASRPAVITHLIGDATRPNTFGPSRGMTRRQSDVQHREKTNEYDDCLRMWAIGVHSVAPPKANWASTEAAAFTATTFAQSLGPRFISRASECRRGQLL